MLNHIYYCISFARYSAGYAAYMHIHHEIDYIEFSVTNIAEAKHFYSKAFDWEFTDYSSTYVGIKGRDKEIGGFTQVAEVRKGGVLAVLYSHNLEEGVISVRTAGGTILKEIFSFPGGRRFHFHDPSGNELAVWSDT